MVVEMAVQVSRRYLTSGTRLGRGDRVAAKKRPAEREVHEAEGLCGRPARRRVGVAHPRIFSTEVETSLEFFIGRCAQRGYEEMAWPSSR